MINRVMENIIYYRELAVCATKNFVAKDQRGVTAVEYAIVLAGVAAIVAVIFGKDGKVSDLLTNIFSQVDTQVKGAIGGGK